MTRDLTKILCADDEPEVRAMIELALGRVGGFDLRVCAGGAEALSAGPAFGPDLMLIDVVMPEMDGPDFAARARRVPELAAVPLVFLTGKSTPDHIARFRAMGALGVVSKPFDIKGLAAELSHLWRGAGGT